MDIRQIEAFVAVAQTGNFTKAAEKLFISRQALSKSVRKLEEECGRPLLSVESSRPVLTADGQRFLETAQDTLEAFYKLEGLFSPMEGSLRLAVCNGLFETTPQDFGSDFFRPDSGVQVEVEETSSDGALSRLRAGEVDICLLGSHPKYLQEFTHLDLAHPGYFLCVPLQSPLATRDYIDLSDMENVPLVTLGGRNHLHRFFTEQCAREGVEPNIVAQLSDSHIIKMYADQPVCSFSCAPKATRPHMATVDIPFGMHDAQVFGTYACRRKAGRLPAVAERFWDYLKLCHAALVGEVKGEGLKAHI